MRFTEYRRRQLPAAEHRQVAEHVMACPSCRQALEADRALSALLTGTQAKVSKPAKHWKAAACFFGLLYWLVAANQLMAPIPMSPAPNVLDPAAIEAAAQAEWLQQPRASYPIDRG